MKKIIILAAFITLVFAGCSSQKTAVSGYDDVYNSTPSENGRETKQLTNEDLSSPQTVAPDHSSSKELSYYDEYDNASAQGNTDTVLKKSYYDEYNYSLQQAGENDGDVNVSIGSSWTPYFWGPAISIGYGMGYPYYGSAWDYPYYHHNPYWYYPYYSCGYYGWGGYWNGYNNGYWDGYYDGSWGYYPYSTSYYYGPRKMSSTSGNYGYYNDRDSRTFNKTVSERSSRDVITKRDPRTTPGGGTSNTNVRDTRTVNNNSIRDTRTTSPSTNQRTDKKYNPTENARYKYEKTATPPRAEQKKGYTNRTERYTQVQRQPTPKYTRPGQERVNTRSETQNYSSPTYRQPKSSQEYVNPGNKNRGNATQNPGQRSVNPSSTERSYSSPSNNQNNSRRYSTPSNSNNRNYSNPSRSEQKSTPSRSSSTPSYSSPSKSSSPSSSPSYSSPSRSGGGSSSPSNSGSGGRRR